jgi:hypothetical protein
VNHRTNPIRQIVVYSSLFLYLLMSSLFLGSWSGSDYQAYNNALLCRSEKIELCIREDTNNLVNSKLEISDNESVFTQKSSGDYQEQYFVENLPSSPFLSAMSITASSNAVQSIFHVHLTLALLVTIMIALAVWTTTRANRRNTFVAIFLILSVPAFSSVASTAYPVVISSIALIIAMVAVRRILNTSISRRLLVIYTLEFCFASILVLSTRYETTAVLIFDVFLVTARSIYTMRNVNFRIVLAALALVLLLIGFVTNPYFKNLNGDVVKGSFATLQAPTVIDKPSMAEADSEGESESFVLNNGRIGSIIAAPSIYVTEIVVLPWLTEHLPLRLALTVLVLLMLFFVLKEFRFFKLRLFDFGSLLLKVGILLLIPGVSAYGSIRLLYALPFLVSILIELLAGGYFIRQRLSLLAWFHACIFVISMTLFVFRHDYFDFYYFRVDPSSLVIVTVLLMAVSIRLAFKFSGDSSFVGIQKPLQSQNVV